MNSTRNVICFVLLCAGFASGAKAQQPPPYRLSSAVGRAVTLERDGKRALYQPLFTIIRSETDPKLGLSPSTESEDPKDVNAENYRIPRWSAASGGGMTDVVYEAGTVTEIRATNSRPLADGGVAWIFAPNPHFSLEAEIRAIAGESPRISWRFTALTPGWYSVGYTGGPAIKPEHADGFLQPLIWQEKRFPRAPLTTAESMGGLPLTLVTRAGVTYGLSVDPRESPYRLPTIDNARFGVMLRNPKGEAQPSAFAPLLGQPDSHLLPGQSATFSIRPLIVTGNWYQAFTEVARNLFGFANMRQNVDQSLNTTIDNMTQFAMDDVRSGWDSDLKGFDYNTDVTGAVKVVSALHPLAASLVQDDPEIYRLRALPITEFLMSRTKYLYNASPDVAGQPTVSRSGTFQNPAPDMQGPAAEVSELCELYQMSHGQSSVFRHFALQLAGKSRSLNLQTISNGANFWDELALYRLTGDQARLAKARSLADKYIKGRIETPQRDFSDVQLERGGQFMLEFASRFVELFELWQETKDPRYLAAAHTGARLYASFAWYFPKIPDHEVAVDRGGLAPTGVRGGQGMRTPEVMLPAWVVSQIGLTPEAQTTYDDSPAVFLAHPAAYELRIAAAVNDSFLHDAARAAIVGRYKTYPGYSLNTAFSNVYARADYQNQPFADLTYTRVYYNHVWPHIALLTDYLLSDFDARSRGAIEFPSRYAQGYAYLRSKVYGDRPGHFMGDDNVRLWMPRHVVQTNEPQANYLTGYGNGRFYLALTNESSNARSVSVILDRERIPYEINRRYLTHMWIDGKPAGTTEVLNGAVTLPLLSQGITAIAVDDMPVFTRLQADYFVSGQEAVASDRGFRVDRTPAGQVTAMFLSFAGQHEFYLWTSASDSEVREARLNLRTGSQAERTLVDRRHPFEFSVPAGGAASVDYQIQFVRLDGTIVDGGWRSIAR